MYVVVVDGRPGAPRSSIPIYFDGPPLVDTVWDHLASYGVDRETYRLWFEGRLVEDVRGITLQGSDSQGVFCVTLAERGDRASLFPTRSAAWPEQKRNLFSRRFLPEAIPASQKSHPELHFRKTVYQDQSQNADRRTCDDIKRRAQRAGCDADLHIVHPEAYFSSIGELQNEIVEASTFAQNSVLSLVHGIWSGDLRDFQTAYSIPDALITLFEADPKSNEDTMISRSVSMSHLLGSYLILCQCLNSIHIMNQQDFCGSAIYVPVKLLAQNIAEIRAIDVDSIKELKARFEEVLSSLLNPRGGDEVERESDNDIVRLITSCDGFLSQFGPRDHQTDPVDFPSALNFCRMTAALLDTSIVSYTGSHVVTPFQNHLDCVNTIHGMEFSWKQQQLSCLNGMLDGEKVWVVNLPLLGSSLNKFAAPSTDTRLGVLTKIQYLADLWGPVWAVPGEKGDISHYNTSKGVIYCVEDKVLSRDTDAGAALLRCHWSSHGDGSWQTTPRVSLQLDDLLFIGGDLMTNPNCNYTMDQYVSDHNRSMSMAGTRAASWKVHSREVQVGLQMKFASATMVGTQKLCPETNVKQHIMDKWINDPESANPELLNNAYGVIISHCTGNAERCALKKLLLSAPLKSLLEDRKPGWSSTTWGSAWKSALESADPDAVITAYSKFREHRRNIADLICCGLDLLDGTGHLGDHFEAALINKHQKLLIRLDKRGNEWCRLLHDSRILASYVLVDQVCMETLNPKPQLSTCKAMKSFTTLQTYFSFDKEPRSGEIVAITPSRDSFRFMKRPDGSAIALLSGSSPLGRLLARQQVRLSWSTDAREILVCAASSSYNGWRHPKTSAEVVVVEPSSNEQKCLEMIHHIQLDGDLQ